METISEFQNQLDKLMNVLDNIVENLSTSERDIEIRYFHDLLSQIIPDENSIKFDYWLIIDLHDIFHVLKSFNVFNCINSIANNPNYILVNGTNFNGINFYQLNQYLEIVAKNYRYKLCWIPEK